MERKASEILREAKALIDTEEKWAVKPNTAHINRARAGEDVTLCAGLAIIRVSGVCKKDAPYIHFCNANNIPQGGIPYWNDAPERTHAQVMAAFDRAIAIAEADENKEWTLENTRAWLDMQYKQLPREVA